jgi:signal peptide peptidase SppA
MPVSLPHLASRVFGVPLLVQPQKLGIILRAIGPRIGLGEPSGQAAVPATVDNTPERKPYQIVGDGIAVISILGTLVRRSSFVDAASGLTSYSEIENEFLDAATDPAIKGILLDIDSPGGEAGGVFDLANTIASQRGSKPIYAVANDDMYSAAYWIGSAADRVFCTVTGGVGSIGIICLHVDQSQHDEKEGNRFTAIYAGDHKNDLSPHAPLADSVKAQIQSEVNRLYGLFTGSVAAFRGMSVEAVQKTQAGMFFGPSAVAAGLADEVGNVGDALLAIHGAIGQPNRRIISLAGTSVAANSAKGEVTLVSEQINVADPTPATSTSPPEVAATAVESPQPVAATTANPAIATGNHIQIASTYSHQDALDVLALCTMAKAPISRAQEFIAAKTPYAQVATLLLKEKAEESSAVETNSAILPAASTQHGQNDSMDLESNPLVQMATQMAKKSGAPFQYGRRG